LQWQIFQWLLTRYKYLQIIRKAYSNYVLFIALDRTGTILPVERETNPIKNLLKCITSKWNQESTNYLLLTGGYCYGV
jgi:hypothetical protein